MKHLHVINIAGFMTSLFIFTGCSNSREGSSPESAERMDSTGSPLNNGSVTYYWVNEDGQNELSSIYYDSDGSATFSLDRNQDEVTDVDEDTANRLVWTCWFVPQSNGTVTFLPYQSIVFFFGFSNCMIYSFLYSSY